MRVLGILNSVVLSFGILLIAFAVLSWLKVPVGSFGDWVVGLLAFFWLVVIVTVPWNIHFQAKAVLADAKPTHDRGLAVDEGQVSYVARMAMLSFWIAIGLHVVSAIVLFVLAKMGIARIGYVASIVALLLTALRPAMSAYEYLAERLRTIRDGWKYPHQDVVELRNRVTDVEGNVKAIMLELDPERPESLVSLERAHAEESRREIARAVADIESLRAKNENEHERLSQEARSAISQLSTDGQFLDHVREIIRFFKTA